MNAPPVPTYPATAEGLSAALAALGNTPNAVADILTRDGHTGPPESPCHCPVARYLTMVIPDGADIAVGDTEAELHTAAGAYVLVSLPPAVAAFVTAFDTGGYDALAVPPGGESTAATTGTAR